MSKERLGVNDTVELVLRKADGTIITNEATIPITVDHLKNLIKIMESNTINVDVRDDKGE
jgi:hypothetical protein